MKQTFSIFLLLFFISKSYSQDTIYLHGIDDTIPTTKEKAVYYKVINTKVNPIESITYYANGVKVSKEHFSSMTPQIKDGEYEKGFIEEKSNFKNNLREGKSFTFYENGKLSRMDVFIRDTLRLSTCYDTIGNVIKCIANNSQEKEILPSFPGGVVALMKYLTYSINSSYITKTKNNIDGKVIVKFYIDLDGSVKEPVVLKNNTGIKECEGEALRIVLEMPKWHPGTQKGKPVKVYYTLPLDFKINN